MDTAHFHTGIEEEDTGSKHHVVEVRQVGEEAAVEVQVGVSTGGKVDNTQDNQQCGRDNSPDQAADLCHFTYPAHALHGDERSQPVDDEDNNERVILVIGQ